MAQPIRKNILHPQKSSAKVESLANFIKKRQHPQYGTSKLEDYFAENFLDALGIKYIRQFEAKEIWRFYDFFIEEAKTLLEVDGDFYHSYGLTYEEKNPMQKRNARVDKLKDEWAINNGYGLIRIWEHDIHDNPEKVMKMLKEKLGEYSEKQKKINEKNKRH